MTFNAPILDRKMSRRSFVATTGACAALASLGFTVPAMAAGNDTFIYAIAGDPSVTPNPATTSDRYGLMTLKLVYSPLWTVTDNGIHYFIASGYEVSEDGLTYTIHIRDDVKFNDGTPLTADDVVFTYETLRDNETFNGSSDLNYGEQGKVEIAKVDDYTVTMTLPFLNPAGAESLAGEKFIMPKHLYEGVTDFENNDVNALGVGTGPYKLDEYQIGQYLSFSANEDYFLGKPNIAKVVFQIITNENTAATSIQTGEINAWIATPAQAEQLNAEANGLTITGYSEGRVAFFAFNALRMTDENVRKAFFYSLDKDTISTAALLSPDNYELAYTFLPPANPWATEDVEKYERDVEKAKQLLADAGQPNPHIVIGYSSSDSLQTIEGVMMQEMAAEAGFEVELRGMDASALIQAMFDENGTLDGYFGGYIMGIDPDKYTDILKPGAPYNYMHYDEPQITELLAAGRAETDEAARHEIYNELQAVVQDTATFYPLYNNKRLLVTTANVKGIEEAGLVPVYTFEDISKLSME